MVKVIALALLILCAGCGQYGYHPQYIISHDEEATVEIERR